MKKLRKPLALLLVLILCLSLLPAAAFAEEEEPALSAAQSGEASTPEIEPDAVTEPDPAAEDPAETENGDPDPANGDAAEPGTEDPEDPACDAGEEPTVTPEDDPGNEDGTGENAGGETDGDPAAEPETDPETTDETEEELETASLTEEQEEGARGETVVVINPLYADVISEEDIPLPEEDAELSVMATAPTFTTKAAAAEYLRDAMIARQESIAFSLEGSYSNPSATANGLFDRAVAHSGLPKGGDSLLFEYGGYGLSMQDDGTALSLFYEMLYYTTAEQEQALDAVVAGLVSTLGLTDQISEYEKSARIYNYLTKNVEYDYGDTGLTMFTAYAALVDHKAVCQGYSVAFYRLALEAGLDARIVTSDAMNHAWNIAGVGSAYYYLDATWDAGNTQYRYFLRGRQNWITDDWDGHDGGDQFSDASFAAAYPVPEDDFDENASLDFSLTGAEPKQTEYTYNDEFEITLQFDGEAKNDIASVQLIFQSPSGTTVTAGTALEAVGDGSYRAALVLNNRYEPGSWKVYGLSVSSSTGTGCCIYNSELSGGSGQLCEDLSSLAFELTGTQTKANLVLGAVSSLPGEYSMEDTVTLRLPVSGDPVESVRIWLYSPAGYGDYGEVYTVEGSGPADEESGELLCSFTVTEFRNWATDPEILEGYFCGTWELLCIQLTDGQGNTIYYGDRSYCGAEGMDEALTEEMDLSAGNFVILPRYTVIYSSNESPDSAKNKTVTQSCRHRTWETALPNSFTRKHYSFAGWNTQPDGSGDFYADGGSFMDLAVDSVGASAILYAMWEPERFPLTYVLNGGVNDPENPETYAYGEETPLLDATREGYAFAGWYPKKNLSGKKLGNIAAGSTGAKTVYAKWTPNPDRYAILFDGNGAETGATKAMANLAIGKKYTLSGNGFAKTGYHFAGWAESPEGEVLYANKAKVMDLDLHGGSATLYAVWEANSYSLVFKGNGGTWVYTPEGKTKAVTAKSYSQPAIYDREETLEENRFRRTGYTFTGWNTKAKGTGSPYAGEETVLNLTAANKGKVTLYAQWQANSYTIRFDPGDGTGAMEPQAMTYGKSAKLSPLGFEKPGYRFTGWSYTDAAGKTKTFANKASVKNLAAEEGAEAVLTAQWAVNTYSISFSANGGKGKAPAVMKNLRYRLTTQPLPENPFTRSGYDFAGWNTKKDGSGEFYTTTDIPVAKNKAKVTLYAVWAPQA